MSVDQKEVAERTKANIKSLYAEFEKVTGDKVAAAILVLAMKVRDTNQNITDVSSAIAHAAMRIAR